jgi:hypothetical protein
MRSNILYLLIVVACFPNFYPFALKTGIFEKVFAFLHDFTCTNKVAVTATHAEPSSDTTASPDGSPQKALDTAIAGFDGSILQSLEIKIVALYHHVTFVCVLCSQEGVHSVRTKNELLTLLSVLSSSGKVIFEVNFP